MRADEGLLCTCHPPKGLERSFARGLETLWLAYQPIVQSADNALFGWEALVRTGEPSLSQAAAVVRAADELERVLDLGRAVRECIAGHARVIPFSGLLFVNVDVRELSDPTLRSQEGPFARLASRVILEITERTSIDRLNGMQCLIAELREMGYRIAIDDLGAGYAGLASFAQIVPEVVKIDRSLIQDIDTSTVQQKLVRAMASVAHDLGCLVVGEGVETETEREVLQDLGCDLLQGYLLGRPTKYLGNVHPLTRAELSHGSSSSAETQSAAG